MSPVMAKIMALSVSRWRNLESESSKASAILMSCIAVMVVTTLRGVYLIYYDTVTTLIGVTEPIRAYEFCIRACGSDWPPWHVSEPLQCRAVTQASKVHSLSSMLSISLLVHLFKSLLLLCE